MPGPPFRHLLDILWRRECGFYDPYPQRSCAAMLRSIYKDKENNFFDCIYQETSSKHIIMIENRLYFDNLSVCKTFYGHEKPQLQYEQMSSMRQPKISDFTAVNAVGLERSPVPRAEYRNVFYVLNQSSVLSELDLMTGERLREVYLADSQLCKFKSISFHDELNRMYIESNCNPRKAQNPEVIHSVVVFQVLPLKLLGFVELRKAHFGSGHHPGGALKATDFHNDILITYHGHSREKLRAYFYDFSQILCPSNKLFDAHLDRYCDPVGLVGHRPTGIPVNYLMKDLPPPLYFIDRNVEGIQFSPMPLMHIVAREKDVFEVYETASQKLIGTLGAELSPDEHLGYDMDDYMVTMDYHDRIVYKGAERILVYSVRKHSNSGDQADLVLDFELQFPEANNPKETSEDSLPTRVMPARLSKSNRLFSLCEVSIKIAALNYCETLELFIVLADIPSYAKTGSVLMYDAIDGQLMLQFHTPLIVTNKFFYEIHLYYDYIYILEKAASTQKFRVLAFQLFRDVEPIK